MRVRVGVRVRVRVRGRGRGVRCCSAEMVIPVTSASGNRLAMYLVSK